MEDEIDLRQYIKILIKNWFWILALTLGGTVIAAIMSFFVIKPKYEATALIIVRPPLYTINLDPRLETNFDLNIRYYKALPDLAESDKTLAKLLAEPTIANEFENPLTIENLRTMLDVEADTDANLIKLTVSSNDPELAARIANLWANYFYDDVVAIYGESQDQVKVFEEELATATAQRDAAQQALVDFQGNNQAPVLNAQLVAVQRNYNLLLEERTRLEMISQNIAGLRSQLAVQPVGEVISSGDDLTALLLQLQAFNAQSNTIQLQITGLQSVTTRTNAEGIRFLDELVKSIQNRQEEIDAQLIPLETEILDLQQGISDITAQYDRLTQDLELAKTVYTTIANKYAETRISLQISAFGAQIASQATVPQKSVGPRKMINMIAGGMLGFVFSVIAILFSDYWRTPAKPTG